MARIKDKKPVDWVDEIEDGFKFRREYGLEDSWADLEASFFNLRNETAGPNLTLSTGDSLMSSLSVPYPYITVVPRQEDSVDSAPVLESVDNWLLSELDVPEEVDLAIMHAFLWSRGVLKIGYDSEFGYSPGLDVGSDALGMTFSQYDRLGNKIESPHTTPGMPWIMACPPQDIIVPWGTCTIDRAPWVVHRVIRHIDEVKSDPKYSNTKRLRPNMSMRDYVKSYQTSQRHRGMDFSKIYRSQDSKIEFVEMFEIHNTVNRRVQVLVYGHDKWLRNDVDALQIDGVPFVELGFVPRTRAFWTTPDAYFLRQAQAEMDDISFQGSKQRRISVLKFLLRDGVMDDNEVENLLSYEIGAVAKVKQGSGPLSDILFPVNNANNALIYQDAEHVRRNAREMVGFSRNQSGEFETTGRRTATEVNEVAGASSLRIGRRQLAVRRMYVKLFRKLNQIIFRFWKTKRMTQVLGPENAQKWQEFDGESISGEYSYEISFSNEIAPSASERRRAALELYSGLAGDPTVNPNELKAFLSRAMQDPSFGRMFKSAMLSREMQEMQASSGSVPKTSSGQNTG
jgi:hypothetical protein